MDTLDFHSHVGNNKGGPVRTFSNFLSALKLNQVSHSVVFCLNEAQGTVEEASFNLLDKAKGHPNLFPFFRFDLNTMTEEKLEEALSKGFRGVKLHPRAQNFDPLDEKFSWIFDRLSKSGKPVLIHARCEGLERTEPLRLVELARRFPKMKLVLGHFGGALTDVFKQVKELDNLFLETSIVSSHFVIAEAVKVCGADKILFGSDAPFSDIEIERLKILKAPFSDEEKEKILFKNAAKLLGLS
ncbi:MAG: amidohydrolase family protein [Nanoarchaeota archaeon]